VFSPNGNQFFVSTGGDNSVRVFDFKDGQARPQPSIKLGPVAKTSFAAGLAIDPQGKRLYAVDNLASKLIVADVDTKRVVASVPVGAFPYTCAVSADGERVYVSNWGAASVSVVDAQSNQVLSTIAVGDHPNDLVFSADGKRLFVATANDNRVHVIDTATGNVIERIWLALYPKAPEGTTSNGMTVNGNRLYVANADNNDLAVVDISDVRQSKVMGFIPTGWYPTAVRTSKDNRQLFVLNGKGLKSSANPIGPSPLSRRGANNVLGRLITGAVSVITTPTSQALEAYTKQVYKNTPYTSDDLLTGAKINTATAIPDTVGAKSPIKHVIYVIKENRTYDQVFGDIPEGNGDPNLCLFGEKNTPNHHALVREFVLLDNLFANAEVSAGGHNWSTAAYATDYVEKNWQANYSDRNRPYDFEGPIVAAPSAGYIWDGCQKAGLSYRSYGEFIENGKTADEPSETEVKSLKGHFDPHFRGFDVKYTDQKRMDEWIREFEDFKKNGQLPQFEIVRLPNDHTAAASAQNPGPAAMVADNDLALGRMIDAISHSDYWKDTAVFVIEDDAQNGPDHVDAHRTVALVISPYTKRHYVDSTMYSTVSILRTMELILGIPPMSQYDAAATPMFNAFTNSPNLEPYTVRPAQMDLNSKNPPDLARLVGSPKFDLDEEDAAPDIEFNQIIWKIMRGANAEMPAPVRSAFLMTPRQDGIATAFGVLVDSNWTRGFAGR
jgi:YVTN family beta-propeller protein